MVPPQGRRDLTRKHLKIKKTLSQRQHLPVDLVGAASAALSFHFERNDRPVPATAPMMKQSNIYRKGSKTLDEQPEKCYHGATEQRQPNTNCRHEDTN